MKLVDTAGIRQSQDLVETLGIETSYQAMADADLTLLVLDGSRADTDDDRALLENWQIAVRCSLATSRDLRQQLTECRMPSRFRC